MVLAILLPILRIVASDAAGKVYVTIHFCIFKYVIFKMELPAVCRDKLFGMLTLECKFWEHFDISFKAVNGQSHAVTKDMLAFSSLSIIISLSIASHFVPQCSMLQSYQFG